MFGLQFPGHAIAREVDKIVNAVRHKGGRPRRVFPKRMIAKAARLRVTGRSIRQIASDLGIGKNVAARVVGLPECRVAVLLMAGEVEAPLLARLEATVTTAPAEDLEALMNAVLRLERIEALAAGEGPVRGRRAPCRVLDKPDPAREPDYQLRELIAAFLGQGTIRHGSP
jgi:hypothetical protein